MVPLMEGEGSSRSARGRYFCPVAAVVSWMLLGCRSSGISTGANVDASVDVGAPPPAIDSLGRGDDASVTDDIDAETGGVDRPCLPIAIERDERVLFASFATWTATVGGAVAVDLTGGDGYGPSDFSAILTTDGNGGTCYIESPALADVDLTGMRLRTAVKVGDRARLRSGAAWLEVTLGDGSLTNAYQFYWADSDPQPAVANGQWAEFSWPWPERRSSGRPDRSAIKKMRFRVFDNGGGQGTTVQLGKVSVVPDLAELNPNGLVSIWFDDGWDSVHTLAFPILKDLGLRATCAIITDLVGTSRHMTLSELQELAAAGWDIVEHSPTQAIHQSGFTAVDPSVLLSALVADRAWFADHGFDNRYLSYPHGRWSVGGTTDARAVAIAAGFSAVRTIWNDNPDVFPPSDPFTLRAVSVNGLATTNDRIRSVVRNVSLGPAMVGLVYHQIVTTSPIADTQTTVDAFRQHMDILLESGVRILPISAILPGREEGCPVR